MERVKLNVLGITFSQVQAGAYALVLEEEGGARRVPIIIGTPEAQSIAIFLEGLNPPRPLTHDLFTTFLLAVHIHLDEVFIYKFEEGVFYSEIIFNQNGERISIDSRTSDAIALAIRTHAPIYTTEEIMKEGSIIMAEENQENQDSNQSSYPEDLEDATLEELDFEELQTSLAEAIATEDYERASQLRDLINKKKKH